ncbi:hypothetical protein [Caballeronia sp. DA-9]|uniref:hypothetical protein n=1 Tax=Caballeronia sp. DA-9 TaxID=3436237 RepID=UPI003F66AEA2
MMALLPKADIFPMQKTTPRVPYYLLASLVGIALLMDFGRFIELSMDFVQHFMLVDEIMKHGERRPEVQIGIMSIYPAGAHWLAAVGGWIGGSGLVAIVLISIASVYVSYLLVLELVGKDSPVNLVLVAVAFILLAHTHSLIGWEVVLNFFYSQQVADVLLLMTLGTLARMTNVWARAFIVLVVGVVSMWVHALIAIQILGCGLLLMFYEGVRAWHAGRSPVVIARALGITGAGTVLILLFHPSFKAMRAAAETNGYVQFSYSFTLVAATVCGAIALLALWRNFSGRSLSEVDAVLGCAGLATAILAVVQYIVLHVMHAGSDYAVKKHMFVVVTLAMINGVRFVGDRWPRPWRYGWLAAPVLAGFAAFHILEPFSVPVVPVLRAIEYANHVAQFDLPGFRPGNTVSYDKELSPEINLMISNTSFQHPFGDKQTVWLNGGDPTVDAQYVMVRRSPEIDARCKDRFAESATYVMVMPDCMKP